MKYNGNNQAIFQSFLFNIVILMILIAVGSYYIYPEYQFSEEKKVEFQEVSQKYNNLITKGLSFGEFKKLHTTNSINKKWEKKILLNNILISFREDDYNDHFTSTGGIYTTFLDLKIIDAKEKRKQQQGSNIISKISKILPEYTSDSSLSKSSLTDFKFINYIERLLDKFQLSTKDKIWIGNLVEIWKRPIEKWEKRVKEDPLEGIIYKWLLKLSLVWEKKNIVNFIHYIENVWKISVKNKEVSIPAINRQKLIINKDWKKIRNNYLDIVSYFKKWVNPYNNLLMEVENLTFSDYLDSSDLPTPDNYSLIKLIKENQGDEKFKIEIELAYYVKGLPTFKIEKFINGIIKRHTELSKVVVWWVAYVSKNRSKLIEGDSIAAIANLTKINTYIKWVKKDLDAIKKLLTKKENLWEIYKKSQDIHALFEIIRGELIRNLKAIPDWKKIVEWKKVKKSLYERYKNILNK